MLCILDAGLITTRLDVCGGRNVVSLQCFAVKSNCKILHVSYFTSCLEFRKCFSRRTRDIKVLLLHSVGFLLNCEITFMSHFYIILPHDAHKVGFLSV